MKIRVVLVIVPLIILALALAGGSVLLWRLLFFSLLIIMLSYLWALSGFYGIRVRISKLPERAQVGTCFDTEITVLNKSRLPKSMITMRENSDLPGRHSISSFNLPARSSHLWQTKVYCQHRGQYNLGSLTTTIADPFGLFTLRRNFGKPQKILVHPAIAELPFFQPESPGLLRYGSGSWLLSEVSPNAARVREYANGDTLNHIHWQSTAHTGKLMVKVFDPDRIKHVFNNIWIVLDMYHAAQLSIGDETTEEYGVIIAASLIKKYLCTGKQVGLIASGDQPYFFAPGTGDEYLRQILDAMALMKATGKVPINQLISQEKERFEANSTVIIITAATGDPIAATARHLKNHGHMAIVILLDPISFAGEISAVSTAKRLISSGAQVYLIRHGQELAGALDSRVPPLSMKYIAGVV